ncbi:UNVERIFIED_CONTAM: hypothetical protein PYX00_010885 [Menopon gallinae]|uniref:cysteine desulfurase n=1 Tax=Menopon gallinae TaxID=328185 RepID=A0AAW2H6K8_9NEOP
MDFQATTPVDPRVLDAMLPYYTSTFGNAHSRTHSYGWNAEKGVEDARAKLARLINCDPREIIFTSGATESSNLALKGLVEFKGGAWRPHIITTQTEHKCVLDTCRYLEEIGCDVTYLPVDEHGLVSLGDLEGAIRKDTVLISIMAVNNEIGTIQPLAEIGAIAKKHNVPFHCDAAQAVGKIEIDVSGMNIGMMSISGHKMYGPKGVGALYIRRRPRIRVAPLICGGGQERGLRSGTVPVPLVVGLGKAAEICRQEMGRDLEHVKRLSKRLFSYLEKKLKNIKRNGGGYPGCLNISFPYVEGESLMMKVSDVALSSGSACTSASLEPSYVIRALGTKEELAHSSIRFGIGRFTTLKEIKKVGKQTVSGVQSLRELSPLYEMANEGIDLDAIKWGE